MKTKLNSNQIDTLIETAKHSAVSEMLEVKYTPESERLLDKFLGLIENIESSGLHGDEKALWFWVDRDTELGEQSIEQKWYRIKVILEQEGEYGPAIWIDNEVVINLPGPETIEFCKDYIKDYPYDGETVFDVEALAGWLCEETEKCIEMLENDTYMDYIRENIPVMYKVGAIIEKDYLESFSDGSAEWCNDISDEELEEFKAFTGEQAESWDHPKHKIPHMTANAFFNYCAIAYKAMGLETGEMTPREQYFHFSQGQNCYLDTIDPDSEKEFKHWLDTVRFVEDQWHIHRMGEFSFVYFNPINCGPREFEYSDNPKEPGFCLYLASEGGRASKTIKVYLALRRAGVPVYVFDPEGLLRRTTMEAKILIFPKYLEINLGNCFRFFEKDDLVCAIHLPENDYEKIAEKCTWLEPEEIKLAD